MLPLHSNSNSSVTISC